MPFLYPLGFHLAAAWKIDLKALSNPSGCLVFLGSLYLRRPLEQIPNQPYHRVLEQLVSLHEEGLRLGEVEWWMGVDNEDDNKHGEVACVHRVDVVAGVDVDTYMGYLLEVHSGDVPATVEVDDMGNHQL